MAAKRLPMRKIRDILKLKHELGLAHRSIARALHVSIGTVSEYLAKAKEMGLSWPLPEEVDDGQLEARLFPRPENGQPRRSPEFAYIHEELKRHRGGQFDPGVVDAFLKILDRGGTHPLHGVAVAEEGS